MDYAINNYRVRKVFEKNIVTTDHGSYCILSDPELSMLKNGNIDKELLSKLREKGIIIDQSNLDKSILLLKKRNAFLHDGTSLHIVITTLRCDMNCIYCHASSKPENSRECDMSEETAKKTIDFIFQTPNNNIAIEFQGGEPLLNWNILKFIVDYSKKINIKSKKHIEFRLVTNLTKMDDEKMDFLISNNIDICTSLDGPKEVHDHNRKWKGGSSYEHVVKWIGRINQEYKIRGIDKRTNALVTLTRTSLPYWKEIVDEYVENGMNVIHLRFLNNLGVAGMVWEHINYNTDEFIDFWTKAVTYIEELSRSGVDIKEYMVDVMSKKIGTDSDPNYAELRSPCGAVIGQLAYNPDGRIFTCDEARMIDEDLFMLGTVDERYKDIVTCNKACAIINASINDQYICDNCAYKPYCGICPVCNYAEQGNIIGTISKTARCKIFMAQFDWVMKEKIYK